MISIQKVLCPLFIMCFIVGVNIYPVKLKPRFCWIMYLSVLYSLTIWLLYSCFSYYAITLFTLEIMYPTATVIVTQLIALLSAIISTIMNFYHQKTFAIYIKKLAIVDDTLEEMGTPKTYSKLYMLTKLITIAWLANQIIFNIYIVIIMMKKGLTLFWALLISIIMNYPTYVNGLTELLLIYLLWNIGVRFDKVNKHIRQLLVKEKRWLQCTRKKYTSAVHRCTLPTKNYKEILWTSIHLHLELCRIARKVNLIFEVQMCCIMTVNFFNTTTMFYFLCLILTNKKSIELYNFFGLVVWIIISTTKLYIINYFFECVKIKANNCDILLHHLTNIIRYADLCTEIYQFTLQTMQQPLKFTGMGLFNFGNEFLRKFCITILTYVIIMVEMQFIVPDFFLKKSNDAIYSQYDYIN